MPRPHEIAADARALYGPPAVRPSAHEAGDGALWVDPSAQAPLLHVQSGNWVSLAPAGVPVLRGPYAVNVADIPHDGDTMTLWTPAVGDVLLRLFPDWQTVVQWDTGRLFIGQGVDADAGENVICLARTGTIGRTTNGSLDSVMGAVDVQGKDASGGEWVATAYVCHSADPIQIQWSAYGDPDPGVGHVDLYALVCRAVAP